MNNFGEKVLTGTLWRVGERIGASLVTFIVSVVLARLLDPSEYGVIGLVLIITSVLEVLVDSGFCKALIQKKEVTNEDYSTVFTFNVISSCVLYVLLFLAAPLVELFFRIDGLTTLVRVSGILVVIFGFKSVVQAYIMRNMKFRMFFWATLVGTILSGVIALAMAYAGMGVWALVAQQLINPFVDTILLWITVKWQPGFRFSSSSFRKLFSFGWKLLVIDIVDKVFVNLRTLFVGKFYSTADLGFYDTGRKLPNSIYTNLDSAIRSVVFPAFSSEQNDRDAVKQHMLKTINICTFLTTPVLFGLAACSENLIILLYTEKWRAAVPFMQIACMIWALNSIQALNQQVILSVGRSDITLKQEMIIKCLSVISIVIAVQYSVMAIALSHLVVTLLGLLINLVPNRKLIHCSLWEQFRAFAPGFLLSAAMAVCVFFIGKLEMNRFLQLAVQVGSGMVVYLLTAALLKMDGFVYLREMVKQKLKRK